MNKSMKKIRALVCIILASATLSSCTGADLDNMRGKSTTKAELDKGRAIAKNSGGSDGLKGQYSSFNNKMQDVFVVTDYNMLYGITDMFSSFFQFNLRDLSKGTEKLTSDAIKYGKKTQSEQAANAKMGKDAVSAKIQEGKVNVNTIKEIQKKAEPTNSADDFKNIMKDFQGLQTPDGKYFDANGNIVDNPTGKTPQKPPKQEASPNAALLKQYEEELYELRGKAYKEYQERKADYNDTKKINLTYFSSLCADMDKKVYDIMILGNKIRKEEGLNSTGGSNDIQAALDSLASTYPGFIESSKAENFGQLLDATTDELAKVKSRIAEIVADIEMITKDPEGFDNKYEIESAVKASLSTSGKGDNAYDETRETIIEDIKKSLEDEQSELDKKQKTLQRYIIDSKDVELLKAVPVEYIYPEYFESDSYLMFDNTDAERLGYFNDFIYGTSESGKPDRRNFDDGKLYYEDNNVINFIRFCYIKRASGDILYQKMPGGKNGYDYQREYIESLDLSHKAYQKSKEFLEQDITDEERIENYLKNLDMKPGENIYDNIDDEKETKEDDNSNYLATGMYSPRVIYGYYTASFQSDYTFIKSQEETADRILGYISPNSYSSGENYRKSGTYKTIYGKEQFGNLEALLSIYENPSYSDVAGYFYADSSQSHYKNYGYLGFDSSKLTSFHDFAPELVKTDTATFNAFIEYLFNAALDEYIYAKEVWATRNILVSGTPVEQANGVTNRNSYMQPYEKRVNDIKTKYPTFADRSRFVRSLPIYNVIMFNYYMYIKDKWNYNTAKTVYNNVNTSHRDKTSKNAYDLDRVFYYKNFDSFDFTGSAFRFSDYQFKSRE